MTRLVAAAVLALLAFAPAAGAPGRRHLRPAGAGSISPIPFTPREPVPALTEAKAVDGAARRAEGQGLGRPLSEEEPGHAGDLRQGHTATGPSKVWSGQAGEIATGRVDDASGVVTEAWTGPQVAWKMARGGSGAFGGKKINSLEVWLAFCAVFLIGLADLRRPFSLRNLDLLALLSFSVSLWYFNHGRIFTSVPLVYPGLVYLLGRTIWIGIRDRPPPDLAAAVAGVAARRRDRLPRAASRSG